LDEENIAGLLKEVKEKGANKKGIVTIEEFKEILGALLKSKKITGYIP